MRHVIDKQGDLPQGPTDWYYRNLVPRDHVGNLKFRKAILERCYEDHEALVDFWLMCSRDILFYINTTGWTLNPRRKNHKLIPFITYEYQDTAILKMEKYLGEEDIAVPKSRDMGASWCCLLVLEHAWHFRSLEQFLLTSEKQELVDSKSEKALFSKLDFWWDHLPKFMVPNTDRTKNHAKNQDTASAFDGEATVENLGTGDRRSAILLDETAKMPQADAIFTATADVSDCRIFNSTPKGRYGTGESFFNKVRNPDTIKVFMHWTEHPEKRRGLYRIEDGEHVALDPNTYNWQDDYDFETLTFHKGRKARSPWYDKQCARQDFDPVRIAQELDIDFAGSTERLADADVIAKVRAELVKAPMHTGRFTVDPEECTLEFMEKRGGQVEVWCPLDQDGNPPRDQYALGIDVCSGTGGAKISESAISAWNRRTKEQVMEFTANDIRPQEWARYAVAVARWFFNAYMVPEAGGTVNTQFITTLEDIGYHNVHRRRVENIGYKKVTDKLGHPNNDGGYGILQRMMQDIMDGRCTVRSSKVVSQLLEYEFVAGSGSGRLMHAASRSSKSAANKGNLHGDAAIAAGLGWHGVYQRPVAMEEKPKTTKAEVGSMAHRMDVLNATSDESCALVW